MKIAIISNNSDWDVDTLGLVAIKTSPTYIDGSVSKLLDLEVDQRVKKVDPLALPEYVERYELNTIYNVEGMELVGMYIEADLDEDEVPFIYVLYTL